MIKVQALVERVNVLTREAVIRETRRLTAENEAAIAASFGEAAPWQRYVDGSLGKPLEQVAENGFTLTEFDLFSHVITATWEALVRASPVGPSEGGHYKNDHWLFVNGTRRDAQTEGDRIMIKAGDDVVFINPRPYARKIEGGSRSRFRSRMTDRRPGLSVQAPNGVYEVTAAALNRRFGNLARFRFTYRGLVGGAPIIPAMEPRRKGVRQAHNLPQNRFPAIEIVVR